MALPRLILRLTQCRRCSSCSSRKCNRLTTRIFDSDLDIITTFLPGFCSPPLCRCLVEHRCLSLGCLSQKTLVFQPYCIVEAARLTQTSGETEDADARAAPCAAGSNSCFLRVQPPVQPQMPGYMAQPAYATPQMQMPAPQMWGTMPQMQMS